MKIIKTAKYEFNYGEATKVIWKSLVGKEKERVGISFDLENDDNIGDIKEKDLEAEVKTPGGAVYQYKVRARLYGAGGDWENSINYFRCQLLRKWKDSYNWNEGEMFIYIPSYKEGNINLVKSENGKWRAGQDSEGDKWEKPDENKLWKSLVKHCNKRIKEFERE